MMAAIGFNWKLYNDVVLPALVTTFPAMPISKPAAAAAFIVGCVSSFYSSSSSSSIARVVSCSRVPLLFVVIVLNLIRHSLEAVRATWLILEE